MSKIRISAVICTYDRYDCVGDALDSLASQTLPHSEFEVLIIDNSNDRRAARAYWDARDLAGNARVLFSSPPGLSRARNVAFQQATGEVVAFLDDDALADPQWLERYRDYFDQNPEVGVVGGPIAPIWPAGAQTDWLPPSFVGCLTVMDLGDADRRMSAGEYAYGANMAFRTTALGGVAGFDASIGRIGNTTLLSNEEIVLQDALVAAGWQKGYCGKAAVRHRVDERRLTRNWFRSRMAWQAVSEAMSVAEDRPPPYLPATLQRYAQHLGLQDLMRQIFTNKAPDLFDLQLHFVRHLVGYLLRAKDFPDVQPDLTAGRRDRVEPMPDQRLPDQQQISSERSRYVASAPSTGKAHVFTEARPGHAYLFDAYALSGNAGFVPFSCNLWEEPAKRPLEALRRSLDPRTRSLTFLTLDPLLGHAQASYFTGFLDKVPVPVYGFIHRLPETDSDLNQARKIAARLRGVLVLSEFFAARVKERLQIEHVYFVPHHPSKFGFASAAAPDMRQELGIGTGQIVVGLLGELRKGKGLELVIDTMPELARIAGDRFVFVISGKCADYDLQDIRVQLDETGCQYRLLAGNKADGVNYMHLNSRSYTRLLRGCDLGLLLYQGGQRDCVSGLLADYIWFDKPVIATADSMTGKEVARYELGYCLDNESPAGLAELLLHLANQPTLGLNADARQSYRKMIDPAAVARRLDAILCGGDASAVADSPVI